MYLSFQFPLKHSVPVSISLKLYLTYPFLHFSVTLRVSSLSLSLSLSDPSSFLIIFPQSRWMRERRIARPKMILAVDLYVHSMKPLQSVVTTNIPTPHEVLRAVAERTQSNPIARTNRHHHRSYRAQQQQQLHRRLAHAQALDPIFHHRTSKHLFPLGLLFTLPLQQKPLGTNTNILV